MSFTVWLEFFLDVLLAFGFRLVAFGIEWMKIGVTNESDE
jgi:hypothetical protein